jgi:hypothetical protein
MTGQPDCSMTRNAFQQKVRELLNKTDKSQIEIARALGYPNANIITMFKKGTTRIPAEKIVSLALALGQDPALMLREWICAYMPKILPVIDTYLIPRSGPVAEGT